jgi:putative ABC transport system permease protein
MTSSQPAPEPGTNRFAARRAMVRWAVRMVRRDWRQQVLVLSLLTLAVAAAVGFASAAYNLAPVSGNAEFGTASHYFAFDEPDPVAIATDIAAAEEWFGTIEVIGHRYVDVPGDFEPLDVRSQDPSGPLSGPMLALREGRFPADTGEAAVTEGVADDFGVGIGDPLSVAAPSSSLDEQSSPATPTIVGIVENPSDLNDDFALVPLVDANAAAADSVVILIDADDDRVLSFRTASHGPTQITSRGTTTEGTLAAAMVFGVSVVALLFIGLLAAAGFVVIAQRRQRQLGLLAAIGATERQVRLAVISNGLAVGVIAAVLGTTVGVVGWFVVEPRVESAAGFRIARFGAPWWVIVTGMLLAVVAATAAAWWPARVAARTSIVPALSGRPVPPRAAHRSAAVAGAVAALGIGCLVFAGDPSGGAGVEEVDWTSVGLIAAGTVLTIVGVLLVCPLALRLVGTCARPLPVAARLALRDLARYQARSGAALAAIVLALGIPAAIVMAATAAESSPSTGNLPDDHLVVRGEFDGPFVPEPAQAEELQTQVDRIGRELDATTVSELQVAVDPGFDGDDLPEGRPAVFLAELVDEGWRDLSLLYIATPALLAPYGIDFDALDRSADFITVEQGELGLIGVAEQSIEATRREAERVTSAEPIAARYTSIPGTFITPQELDRRGWEAVPSGRWLIETDGPPAAEQLATARDLAAAAGLTIETRDDQAGLSRLRSGATAVAVLLALGVLAMTVGLIRGETAGDLRTLTATGATSGTRRALTAITAAALAILGVVLAVAAAFTVLTIGYLDEWARIPPAHLLTLLVVLPAAAAAAGWLLAGREPPMVSRQAIA